MSNFGGQYDQIAESGDQSSTFSFSDKSIRHGSTESFVFDVHTVYTFSSFVTVLPFLILFLIALCYWRYVGLDLLLLDRHVFMIRRAVLVILHAGVHTV